ncbi:MAG: cytochrome c biogenesis protein ResB [Deferrisomatales bacterium]|nr:cytochrome c biogenesis protein ResB [Deferrisomatales bacterium]
MSSKPNKENRGIGVRLYDFLSSIKLTIWVLIGLAVTSIFGTVIQQGKGNAEYVGEYGEAAASLIRWFQLDDMYHSWWFVLLLSVLLVNITVCSIKRLPRAVQLMRDREPVFEGRGAALHEKWQLRRKGTDLTATVSAVESFLGEHVGKPLRGEQDGKVFFLVSKGGWTRMGVYITHCSLFLFALGALIGGWTGFKGFVNIPEGESISQVRIRDGGVKDLGFEVRCDKFTLEYYLDANGRPTGRPKDYKSELAVLENGRVVATKTIEVNHPLIHNGIYFYQSSYGQAGGKGASLTVFGPRRNLVVNQQRMANGGRIPLENGDMLLLRNTTGDFRGMGPAAEVALEPVQGQGATVVVFENPQSNQRPLGAYTVRLNKVDSAMYTGLQVAKDPGVPVVWAGCILITLGCLVAFFLSHRRVWARVSADDKGIEVFFGGNASRNRISFERWFADLCESAQETFEK